MVSVQHGKRWTIDDAGHIRLGAARDPKAARALGWVDPTGHVGGVEFVDGEPAAIELLPTEILDLLQGRFPGTRWLVGDGRAHAA